MCLAANPGVMSSILVQSHTFIEIDHEIISMAILFPSAEGLLSVTSESMCTNLSQASPGKSVVRCTDRLDMIIADD